MNTRPVESTFESFNLELAISSAATCVSWAVETFGPETCLLTSMQDSILVDVALRVHPTIDVVFLDNGYHFGETLETVARVEQHYGIHIRRVGPLTAIRDDITPGECCDAKTDLLDAALRGNQPGSPDCVDRRLPTVPAPNSSRPTDAEEPRSTRWQLGPITMWRRTWSRTRSSATHSSTTGIRRLVAPPAPPGQTAAMRVLAGGPEQNVPSVDSTSN